MKIKITFLTMVTVVYSIACFAQPGALDPSFSGNGRVTTLVGTQKSPAYGLAIQPDGKILLGGSYLNGATNKLDYAIVRYNVDGTLDNSFAGNGKAGMDAFYDDYCFAMALQPDGKIVAVGGSERIGFPDSLFFSVVRFTSTGQPDNSFGTNGKVLIHSLGQLRTVAVQSDGKIIASGNTLGTDYATFRFNTNGTLDNSFGTQGRVDFYFPKTGHGYGQPEGIAVQPDGKILVTGWAYETMRIATVRFNANGTLDPSFNGTGYVGTQVGSSMHSEGHAITLQSNGKILVAGYYNSSDGSANMVVVRYNTNGTLDNSFAGNGKAAVDFGSNVNDNGNAIVVQQNGQIVISGGTAGGTPATNDFALARLNTDGTPDNSFGNSGKVQTGFGYTETANSIALQSDGKIVAGGTDGTHMMAARYIAAISTPPPVGNSVTPAVGKQNLATMALYPNPSSGSLSIRGFALSPATRLNIFDTGGKIRKSGLHTHNASNTLNVEDLTPGVYFLEITENDTRNIFKFVKK